MVTIDAKTRGIILRVSAALMATPINVNALTALAAELAGVDTELSNAITTVVKDPANEDYYLALAGLVGERLLLKVLGGDDNFDIRQGQGGVDTTSVSLDATTAKKNYDSATEAMRNRLLSQIGIAELKYLVTQATTIMDLTSIEGMANNPAFLPNVLAGIRASFKPLTDEVVIGDPDMQNSSDFLTEDNVERTVTFSKPTDILLGTNGRYVVRRGVTGTVSLTPRAFGGLNANPDIALGQGKQYIIKVQTNYFRKADVPGDARSVLLLSENGLGIWVDSSANIPTQFTAQAFGADPGPYLQRAGYVRARGIFTSSQESLNALATKKAGEDVLSTLFKTPPKQSVQSVASQSVQPVASSTTESSVASAAKPVLFAGGGATLGFVLFGPPGALAGAVMGFLFSRK